MSTPPNKKSELIYVGDPMCSWCWGFSPALNALMTNHPNRFLYSLVLGGLRPGPSAAVDAGMRAYLAHHWSQVHERTGQPFNHDFLERDSFVYDTEPSCRAVVTARHMSRDRAFDFMEAVHEAFYARNQDPTRIETFLDIASTMDLPQDQFHGLFESEELKRETERDFSLARQMGVLGFPSLLLRRDGNLRQLTHGWVDYKTLEEILRPWLQI